MTEGEQQLRIVEDFWRQLSALEATRSRRRRAGLPSARTVRVVVIAVLLLLAVAVLAIAARTWVFGASVPDSTPVSTGPGRFFPGRLLPGTARLLSIRVADPRGGPAWGMRVTKTTKGEPCLQAGRVVAGQLVALGIDGAFGNDGRAHPLAISTEICGGVDDVGNAVVSGAPTIVTASAIVGPPTCRTPEQVHLDKIDVIAIRDRLRHPLPGDDAHVRATERRGLAQALRRLGHPRAACPTRDLRTVIFGMLGPAARTVVLTGGLPGRLRQPASRRDDGAYMFVLGGRPKLPDLRLTVRYRSGLTCLRGQPFNPKPHTDSAACRAVPPGYVYKKRPRP